MLAPISLALGLLFACFFAIFPVFFAFIVLGLVSSVLSQEIGKEKRHFGYIFFLWDAKT